MVTIESAKRMALALPQVEEYVHWGRPSFRIKKKIFATMRPEENCVVLKLSAVDQSVFTSYSKKAFYPVDGAWGKQGWTKVDLKSVRKGMFEDALTTAWKEVAPKKLVKDFETGGGMNLAFPEKAKIYFILFLSEVP